MESIGEITVDSSGSVSIPPDICEQAGFRPGKKLLVEKDSLGEVRLKPAVMTGYSTAAGEEASQVRLVEKDGLFVFEGIPAEWLVDLVKCDREARMNEILQGSSLESFD